MAIGKKCRFSLFGFKLLLVLGLILFLPVLSSDVWALDLVEEIECLNDRTANATIRVKIRSHPSFNQSGQFRLTLIGRTHASPGDRRLLLSLHNQFNTNTIHNFPIASENLPRQEFTIGVNQPNDFESAVIFDDLRDITCGPAERSAESGGGIDPGNDATLNPPARGGRTIIADFACINDLSPNAAIRLRVRNLDLRASGNYKLSLLGRLFTDTGATARLVTSTHRSLVGNSITEFIDFPIASDGFSRQEFAIGFQRAEDIDPIFSDRREVTCGPAQASTARGAAVRLNQDNTVGNSGTGTNTIIQVPPRILIVPQRGLIIPPR